MDNYYFLPSIHSPADLKSLDDRDMLPLADEIRREILAAVSENGGHLASNLGMVEATLALHRVFDCANADTLVFDVGHQCYAHKLLTGRFGRFRTIRQNGGLSGFSNRDESPYDTMTCGHSGSSVSVAMGIAEANRRTYGTGVGAPWTIAVVGDGSFTNGMIFEALNSLAGRELNLIILLNDNEMSISKNVGGLSKYLAYIRTSESYFTFKLVLKRMFSAIPLVGTTLVRAARAVRDVFKRLTNSESFFENLGLEYIGPADGNDFVRMTHVLREAKSKAGPVIVHMKTKKGMGYPPAEEHPEKFHSASPFAKEPGTPDSAAKAPTFSSVFGEHLVRLAETNGELCAITAAMTEGCALTEFAHRYPDRFYDVGIAEEHAVALAGGLALAKPAAVPVLVLYSTFAQRVFDQLWHDVRLQNTHVVLVLSHCGVVPGDGVTHQGLYDLPLLKAIPDRTVYSPATADDLRQDLERAVAGDGLCVVRYPKDRAKPWAIAFDEVTPVYRRTVSGNARTLVCTYGRIAHDVGEVLRESELSADLLVLERILPCPTAELREIAENHPYTLIIVVEESTRSGGIGETVAAEMDIPVKILAVDDPLLSHGNLKSVKKQAGLDTASLKENLLKIHLTHPRRI